MVDLDWSRGRLHGTNAIGQAGAIQNITKSTIHTVLCAFNLDGSLARISNWETMTAVEQEQAMRLLRKRNRQRLAALHAREGGH
jgi:hypothetical protein